MKKFFRNKKALTAICAAALTMSTALCGCGERTDEALIVRESETPLVGAVCVEGCTCTGCICCGTVGSANNVLASLSEPETESETIQETFTVPEAEQASQTESAEEGGQEQTTTQEEPDTSGLSEIEKLSEGEIEARKEQQTNFAEARATLYGLKNSKDKTSKINQMDRQILANNSYDFSKKNIVFIGDSITEGITSAVDINGNRISYVTYADSYLHFQRVLNHGMGGRMFSVYGDESLSLALNFGNVTNVDSDIIVVFAGVNDYLSTPPNKRFGDINDKLSTAGYCGSVRYFMKQLQEYYSDNEIFFVTMYNTNKKVDCTYSDVKGQPTLNDYMDVQRKLAKEYGFNIIELYNIGFMDCTDKESADFYLRDGLHPKDNGNIVLGEHIAAELSLYFGQK
ncbi:MAG: SGNH/GDSL hydrolase family protein [Lachnospiraceae bacterium]|nr:SGNH/GDSL hydrolase family protein [Lachnospiraceae bacterium]